MHAATVQKIRAISLGVAKTDTCLWQLAELMRVELSASQSMIALWSDDEEPLGNWCAWTAAGGVARAKEISSLGGSLTLLNAARSLNQLQTEAVHVADISGSVSMHAHNIRFGMAFPLHHHDLLTDSVSFSGAFYLDRRGTADDFSPADCARAMELSSAVESTVALVHAKRLAQAGLPMDKAKRQNHSLFFRKIKEYKGRLSAMAKDPKIVRVLSSLFAGPSSEDVHQSIVQVGLEPMRLDMQARQAARARLDELNAAILINGNMKKAADAMNLKHSAFRKQHSRAVLELQLQVPKTD